MAKLFESIGKLGLALAIGGSVVNSALFNGGCLSTHTFQPRTIHVDLTSLTSDLYVLDVNTVTLSQKV